MEGVTLQHRTLVLEGVDIHFVQCGPADGPLVVLLHGFPDFWLAWRYQFAPLAAAGFRVVAPDLRGYNRSSKPEAVEEYSLDAVVGDVASLIATLSPAAPAAGVVGHDWGASVAWSFAHRQPSLAQRLAILNVPHPQVFTQMITSSLTQLRKSWYVLAFQVPVLPEAMFAASDYRMLRQLFAEDPKQPVPPDVVEQYVTAFSRPGAITAAINYYRAAVRGLWGGVGRIALPTLVLWGEQDPYLDASMAAPPAGLVPRVRVVRFPAASHWLPWDERQGVADELVAFLRTPVAAAGGSALPAEKS